MARLANRAVAGAGVSWEQWLKIWPQVRLASLPGYPYWERQVFRALSENLGVLLRVFSFYSKVTLMRLLSSASAAPGALSATTTASSFSKE